MTARLQRERLDSLLDQLTNERVPLGLDRKNETGPPRNVCPSASEAWAPWCAISSRSAT
jgi:hypothetical protein